METHSDKIELIELLSTGNLSQKKTVDILTKNVFIFQLTEGKLLHNIAEGCLDYSNFQICRGIESSVSRQLPKFPVIIKHIVFTYHRLRIRSATAITDNARHDII